MPRLWGRGTTKDENRADRILNPELYLRTKGLKLLLTNSDRGIFFSGVVQTVTYRLSRPDG
jgi:hypothetical protein